MVGAFLCPDLPKPGGGTLLTTSRKGNIKMGAILERIREDEPDPEPDEFEEWKNFLIETGRVYQ